MENVGGKGFTFRAVVIAIFMTLFLLASSSYIALKIGALPWPIIFSVVVCGGILGFLGIFKKTNFHEINVAQAGSSIGGLMAAAMVFVIPGIWFLQKQGIIVQEIKTIPLILICVAGGVLGVLLSIPLRKYFVDKQNLAFPSGTAGAETLMSSKNKNHLLLILFVGGLAGMFAMTRDLFFASGFSLSFLASAGIFLNVYPMPLAIGVGYILGKKNSFSWFAGAVVGWLIIIPLLFMKGFTDSIAMVQNIGMGIVLGSGIGFLIMFILPKLKSIFGPLFKMSKKSPWYYKLTPIFSLISILVLRFLGIPLLLSIISVTAVWIVAAIAMKMTGETNINPLEQFGIVVGLLCMLLYAVLGLQLAYGLAFIIVLFVSVTAAIAGDIGQDYKSAKIIKTRVLDIIKVDLITVVVAGIAGPFILEIIRRGFMNVLFTDVMPAPQAQIVGNAIAGFPFPHLFLIGFGLALVMEVIFALIKKKSFVSMMPFGIGMFLGMGLSIMLFIGGIIKWIVGKKHDHKFLIGSAGLMGGEGIAGFIVAAIFVFGITSFSTAAWIMFALMTIIVIISGIFLIKK